MQGVYVTAEEPSKPQSFKGAIGKPAQALFQSEMLSLLSWTTNTSTFAPEGDTISIPQGCLLCKYP